MFLHSNKDCDKKCKINTCLKRHRKTSKNGDYCKYKLKYEFKHDKKSEGKH